MNPVQEQLGGGVTANLLTGGVDEFFSRTDQLGTHSLLTDALGSTLALADSAGALLTQFTYEPFGNVTWSGSVFTPYQYTGRENDGTGLYFYRARYFSPFLQRFVSEDSIQFSGGDINFYSYVSSDPVSFFDPLGLSKYVLIVGDRGLERHNVGNSFNLAAQTAADALRAQGHDVIIQRASNIAQFNAALTQNGLIDGGVEYYGHSWTHALYVGELPGEGTNITRDNVRQLSNRNLGPNTTITLYGCNAGSAPAGSIAQAIANQLRRNVYAFPRSTFFGAGKCPQYTRRGDRAPNKKPVVICQQGGGGPRVFTPEP